MRVDTSRLRVVAHDVATAEALEQLPFVQEQDVPALGEADGDGLPSPGAFIRAQRVRRGMSIEQLAVVTKIPARSIEMLEANEYARLPGQVFVKGFLRCCARALGLSQQAVMDLLYERERGEIQARRKDRASNERAPSIERAEPPASDSALVTRRRRHPGSQSSPARAVEAGAHHKTSGAAMGARATRPAHATWLDRVRQMLPSAHAVLWVVVALLVAFLLLAAFNLAGAPAGVPQT